MTIAAPSMKAAIAAWGADSDLFHQGAAKETDDPVVVATTMKRSDVGRRRPLGRKAFGENAHLPTDLAQRPKPRKAARTTRARGGSHRDTTTDHADEKEDERRERGCVKQEVAHKRAQAAVEEAQAVLEAAERAHDDQLATLRPTATPREVARCKRPMGQGSKSAAGRGPTRER